MTLALLPRFLVQSYEVYEWKHACAILKEDFPDEWKDLVDVLSGYRLSRQAVMAAGGNLSPISKYFDRAFTTRGWAERKFDTRIVVDEEERISPTHKVDAYKNGIAVEIEWNNKDPFFDRDLNNFRLLFDLRAVSVGVIITRSQEILGLFTELGKGKSTGQSTTHMGKLLPRIEGGGGGGCPLLVFGITRSLYVED
jgi:hypothetical protein